MRSVMEVMILSLMNLFLY